MELKFAGTLVFENAHERSNRTFMELKYNFCIAGFVGFEVF